MARSQYRSSTTNSVNSDLKMNEINEFWSWFSKSLDRAIGLAEIGLVINEIGDKLLELNVDSSLWELHSNSKRDAVTQITFYLLP